MKLEPIVMTNYVPEIYVIVNVGPHPYLSASFGETSKLYYLCAGIRHLKISKEVISPQILLSWIEM